MSKADQQIRMQTNGGGDSLAATICRQGRLWLLATILFSSVFAPLVCVVAEVRDTNVPEKRAASLAGESATGTDLPGKTASDTFAPRTEAERELGRVLQGSEIDLALVNWLVAADISEFQDLTRDAYFKQLDAMTEQVRQEIVKMQKVAVARGESLDAAKTRCAIFCNAIIKLRFAYAEQFRQETISQAQMKTLYADPNNICLAGLLRTRRGSCVSMPLIYLVMGQRLRMPVHLVTLGKHYFIRWEEPGFRMNIEPTIVDKVSVSPDDSVYLEIEGVTREQLSGSDLRNLTSREVVGNLLFARSGYWATRGREHAMELRRDLTLAHQLASDDQGIKKSYETVLEKSGNNPKPAAIESKLKRNSL